MQEKKKATSKIARIGDKELSLQDKMVILRERYRREGMDLSDTLGVTRVTLSRWVNGHVGEIKGEYRAKLLKAAGGFLDETDLSTSVAVESKPTPKPVSTPAPKPLPKHKPRVVAGEQDDDDFIL